MAADPGAGALHGRPDRARCQRQCGCAADVAAGEQRVPGRGAGGVDGQHGQPVDPGAGVAAQRVDQVGLGPGRERGGDDVVHGRDVGGRLGAGAPGSHRRRR
jgi:hypothetical protein